MTYSRDLRTLVTLALCAAALSGCHKHRATSPRPLERQPSTPPASVSLQPAPTAGAGEKDPGQRSAPVPQPMPPVASGSVVSATAGLFQEACLHPDKYRQAQVQVQALRLLIRRQESLAEDVGCQVVAEVLQRQQALTLAIKDDDLSPLGAQLKEALADTKDLGLLRDLPALTELTVVATKISSLSSLRHLPLASLTVHGQVLTDLNDLGSLSSLRELRLGGASATEPTGLAELSNLKTLTLVGNDFTSLASLKAANGLAQPQLVHLTEANMSHNQLADVDGIEHIPNLTFLNLDANRLDSLAGLVPLAFLQRLSLQNNRVKSLASLSGLKVLLDLDLSGNELDDLDGLAAIPDGSLPPILHLNLNDNPLSRLDGLDRLAKLSSLSLERTLGPSLAPLQTLTELTSLSLREAHIRAIGPLSQLVKLRSLDLSDNHDISDLSLLQHLPLTSLNLAGTSFENSDKSCDLLTGGHLLQLHNLDLRRTGFDHFARLKELKLAVHRAKPLADCGLFQAHHGLAIEVDEGPQLASCRAAAADEDNQYTCYEYDPTGQTPPLATATRYLSCWAPATSPSLPHSQDPWKGL